MLKHQFAIVPLSILILFTSSCLVAGQVERSGPCREDIEFVSSVDPSIFEINWYMHSRYPFNSDENFRCYKTEYTHRNNKVYRVKNSKIHKENNCVNSKTATITILSGGKIEVEYDEPGAPVLRYNILTYCNDYVISYICENLPGRKHKEFLWINTNHHKPPKHVKDAYIKALKARGISTRELQWINHDNCNY
ncbi:uncharacterized protein [Eurosta solidaginis]|uniref:uncharacterized protein n=1 Tax=Eurosta solidaginis TaxID=178769 RepID=UPI0035314FCF